MATEYEQKFRAMPHLLAQINEAFPEPGQTISMETTYYDTPSGALSARHYTLRRRMENGESVCTLKTPAGAARAEWEIRCDTIAEAIAQIPALGCPEDFESLIQEGVLPICSARFTRIAKTISFENAVIELALDEGVLIGGGKEFPLCEVEAELKEGSREMCDMFCRILASRFALQKETRSKFRRALALYKGEDYA